MQRRRQVLPDENGIVTLEALTGALIEAASWLDFAGGCLTVQLERRPTGLPGEMVTVGALVTWLDRTDAKPQPEQQQGFKYQPEAEQSVASPPEDEDRGPTEIPDPELERLGLAEPDIDPSDGFDYSKLEDEDVESEPISR